MPPEARAPSPRGSSARVALCLEKMPGATSSPTLPPVAEDHTLMLPPSPSPALATLSPPGSTGATALTVSSWPTISLVMRQPPLLELLERHRRTTASPGPPPDSSLSGSTARARTGPEWPSARGPGRKESWLSSIAGVRQNGKEEVVEVEVGLGWVKRPTGVEQP